MITKTIRITFPEWQDGDNKMYSCGARMTEWLAPQSNVEVIWDEGTWLLFLTHQHHIENIIHRQELLQLNDDVQELPNRKKPDKVVVFGGNCLADQAPLLCLTECQVERTKYSCCGVDAHPDVTSPGDYPNAHAMVLCHLLGEGDGEFVAKIKVPVKPSNVMFAGLIEERLTTEKNVKSLTDCIFVLLAQMSCVRAINSVLDWIAHEKIEHLAIHWDLYVDDYHLFRSLLFAESECKIDWEARTAVGRMRLGDVTRLINDVQRATNVVTLGNTEHFPWDAYNLKEALSTTDIMK